ncbi:MAG: hypothetical protein VB035_11515 [Candidatus Fimivivens sp.]|nr:hypothetical protein [Candidatus Fimivivens sp.]
MVQNIVLVGEEALAMQTEQWIEDINKVEPRFFILDIIIINPEMPNFEETIKERTAKYWNYKDSLFVLAFSKPVYKCKAAEILDLHIKKYANIIHPTASISEDVKMGFGNIIFPNATISANAVIENHVTVLFSGMGHDTAAADYVTIGNGCDITGKVKLEKGADIGLAAVILPDKKIGEWSDILPGSVVLRNVRPYSVVGGSPAKAVKSQ